MLPNADLDLARRLERAEGLASAGFAEARRRLFPEIGAESMQCAGAYVIFDGIESPITQTFGLGIYEELRVPELETIERFFFERGAPVLHEVCPFAGVEVIDLLCRRQYHPVELSNVLYRTTEELPSTDIGNVRVRVIGPDEARLWSEVNAKGWSHEHPELRGFLSQIGVISVARSDSHAFLAEINGKAGAAGMLLIHQRVALFAGTATVPEMRRRGLQSALLRERMRYAREQGCDVAMIVAEPGSGSQRNAERAGFRIAYTRTKWRHDLPR